MTGSGATNDEGASRAATFGDGEARWTRFIGFFVDNKFVVFILLLLLTVAGLTVSPFRWTIDDLPRDPIPVDALPDISENQQIVFTKWPGRSPRDMEDQVTYPLTTALLGIPGVKAVRSSSVLGFSSIYVIFEDDVEFYWSRSRVLEKLSSLPPSTLPADVSPMLGPDATALGQVYWYTLQPLDEHGEVVPGAFDLHELRTIQDWTVRYALQGVTGVSEVASIGGHVREYQVDVDPEALLAHGVNVGQVAKAVSHANLDVGARTVEINQVEYLVRGVGFVRTVKDLEEVVIASRAHTPIRVRDVGRVTLGPAMRRGALDDGGAETVGGVVVVRFGENPLAVIDGIRRRIAEIGPGLPERVMPDGTRAKVTLVPFYDRTTLIQETLDTLSYALIQQLLVTIIVVLLVMRHLRTSFLIGILLPLGVLATFAAMKFTGVDANIMALSGIAIAIGTMVDMGIVFTENMATHVAALKPGESRRGVVSRAAGEVAAAVMTSVMTTVVGFLPIFGLTASEGKLFGPLAYTKTFALVAAFLIAVIVLPPLADLVLRSKSKPSTSTWTRIRDAVFDFNGAIAVAGILLIVFDAPRAGVIALTVAGIQMAEPWVARRWRWLCPTLASTLAGVVLLVALTDWWMPLGPGRSLTANTVFVAVCIVVVMLTFAAFWLAYRPLLRWCLRHKELFLAANAAFIGVGVVAWLGVPTVFGEPAEGETPGASYTRASELMPGLGTDFMPPFDEGSYLFMPTVPAHASIGQAMEVLSTIDAAIAAIPEVDQAVGKLGRADSPLDPAPVSMFETVINYKSEYAMTPQGQVGRYATGSDGEFIRDEHGELIPDEDGAPYRQWREHIRSPRDIWNEIAAAAKYPGLTGATELMPIKTRIVMLQSGMRSPIGIKVKGPDLATVEAFGLQLERIIKDEVAKQVDPTTVLADRIIGKPYIEIHLDREAIARYGLSIVAVQQVIGVAVGGRTLTWTVEGRERYPVRVRLMREERDSVEALRRLLVPAPNGEQIPLEQLAELEYRRGPQMIRSEDTFLTGYVTFDSMEGVGEVEAVQAVRKLLDAKIAAGTLTVPDGVSYRFAGTWENKVRADARLKVLVPLALSIIFLLLYLQFRRLSTAMMVFVGVALAGAGGFLLLWAYGLPGFMDGVAPGGVDLAELFRVGPVKVTVAVWVGFLALFGVATDNGVIVATYLTQRFRVNAPTTVREVHELVVEAGARRVRPCLMTTATTLLALLPIVTAPGRGADLMVPMALPTVGGIWLSLVSLLTVPVLFSIPQEWRARRRASRP